MKKVPVVRSTLAALSLATSLAATAARADGPQGWDVEHEQPRLGEAPMVVQFAPPQDPDYDIAPFAPTDQRDEILAGGGGGEPRDTAALAHEAAVRIEKLFSDP